MSPRNNGARSGASKSCPNAAALAAFRPLTPREIEVVHWIAEAKRNLEIAAILDCSPRTVQKHVQNILDALGLENRTAICRWWYERPQVAQRSRAVTTK